jgi:hypothetical protein
MIIISLLSILYFSADQHCMILGIDTSDETCDEGDDAEFSQSIEEAESSRNNDTVDDNDEDDDVLVSYDESSDDESHGSRSLSTKQPHSAATVAEFCTPGQLEQLSPEDRQRIDDEIGPGYGVMILSVSEKWRTSTGSELFDYSSSTPPPECSFDPFEILPMLREGFWNL